MHRGLHPYAHANSVYTPMRMPTAPLCACQQHPYAHANSITPMRMPTASTPLCACQQHRRLDGLGYTPMRMPTASPLCACQQHHPYAHANSIAGWMDLLACTACLTQWPLRGFRRRRPWPNIMLASPPLACVASPHTHTQFMPLHRGVGTVFSFY